MSERATESEVPAGVARDAWLDLAQHTPARIALGRAGGSLPTREVLQFGLAHARARDAVHAPFDAEGTADRIAALGFATLIVASDAQSRDLYLRRPDLGRRLSPRSRDALARERPPPADLCIVVGDGLSAIAIHANAVPLIEALKPWLERTARRLAPVVVARGARVALGDEIGAALDARAVAVLIGERPGLSSPDSLGVYVTLDPRVGRTDAERNCISNVRAGGLAPADAAHALARLLERAYALGLTGVGLTGDRAGDARLLAQ